MILEMNVLMLPCRVSISSSAPTFGSSIIWFVMLSCYQSSDLLALISSSNCVADAKEEHAQEPANEEQNYL